MHHDKENMKTTTTYKATNILLPQLHTLVVITTYSIIISNPHLPPVHEHVHKCVISNMLVPLLIDQSVPAAACAAALYRLKAYRVSRQKPVDVDG